MVSIAVTIGSLVQQHNHVKFNKAHMIGGNYNIILI